MSEFEGGEADEYSEDKELAVIYNEDCMTAADSWTALCNVRNTLCRYHAGSHGGGGCRFLIMASGNHQYVCILSLDPDSQLRTKVNFVQGNHFVRD